VSSPRDLAAALAAEIRAAVAETSRPPLEEPSPGGEEDHARSTLKRSEAHLTPHVPDSAPLAGAKRSALRLLRFLWRDQSSYNALMLETANELLAAVARQRHRLDETLVAIRADLQRAEEKIGRFMDAIEGWRESGERREAIRNGRIANLEEVRSGPASSAGTPPAAAPEIPPGVYSLFEERFRGAPADIRRKQKSYLPYLAGLPGPVLDAGCGRGEFLALLREKGIPARGVESNPIAVDECRAAGLDVVGGDAVADLSASEPGSLGAVTAFQVLEHWPPGTVFGFLRAARRAIAPGGVLIAETINTDSLSALRAFFLDPSHVRPIPPEALEFLVAAAGFVDARIEYSGELSPGERLTESSENDRLLNRLLYAPQDYAVITRVPTDHPIAR
jgi:SAM-dependent methyltransferase